ncbi:MAG TPA: DNA repair protein RadC [Anaerolineae bacterium]|nr:DNA repair protein RadC [Anaerolineae bacterium]
MLTPTHTLHDLPQQERPRERLLRVGERALSTSELLAIMLRTGGSQGHVLTLAQQLLTKFKNPAGLSRATINELMSIHGIGQVKAIEIKAALELGRRALLISPLDRPRITAPIDAANLLMPEMALLEQEHLRLLLLDTRNRVLHTPTIYIGSLNSSVLRVGELFRAALRDNAAAIIVAHNHPSGDPAPSPEDIHVTRQLVSAGKLLDIQVLDHIIIGHQQFVSLKERGLGFD